MSSIPFPESLPETFPPFLEDAITTIARSHGIENDVSFEIGHVESNSDELGKAYTVNVKTYGVSVSGKELSLYVKCMEDTDGRFSNEGRLFFNNEVVFYGEFLMAFKELCKKCPQALFKSSPKCYHSFSSPSLSFMIMENLLLQNYLPLSSTPLTLQQSYQILDSLAKLHSMSFILKDQFPLRFHNIVDRIEESLFREDMRASFGRMFVGAIHDALKLAKASLPQGSIYVDRLAEFTLNVFDRMVDLATKGEDEYKVISHGDVRNANVLMKYDDDDNPTEVCLLDYQACRYSSPAHDLAFFLLVSLPKALRDSHLPSLLRRYHGTLCSCIAQSGSDPLLLFPMSALRAQLASHARFALGLALAGLPLYMDEGGGSGRRRREDSGGGSSGDGSGGDGSGGEDTELDVLEVVREVRGRKSMRCKNKMMEVIIDAVDLGWL